jgi:predicted  nucleic acid-binding Zn-ribbon protein
VSRGGDLLSLQGVDGRIGRDTVRLHDAEAAIAGDPELERRRREARRLRRDQRAADSELATAETEADALRRRVKELDRHLYGGSVGNPQELLGMQRELEALRARVNAEDERLLALMEAAEAAAAAERDANAAVVELEQDRAGHAGELLEQVAALRAALESQQREREALVATLTPADVALYNRLAGRVHPAVVRITGGSCGGCHIPFANSEVRRIRVADEPQQCSGCDRIVVS